jgi:predicted ATPase
MSIINEITIKGFKSILEQKVSLGQINIFIGTNGAGKSNFLEAISMLSASSEGGIDYQKLAARGSRLSSPEIFRTAFKNNDRRKTFEIEAKLSDYIYNMKVHATRDFSYFSESFEKNGDRIAGRSGAGATLDHKSIKKLELNKSILSVVQNFQGLHNDIINNLKNFAIFSPSTPILRGVSEDTSHHEPLGLYGGNLAKALKHVIADKNNHEEMQRFFQLFDWFQSIGTTSSFNTEVSPEQGILGGIVVNYNDKFMSKNFNELYAYDVSEGALFILFVLTLLVHNKSPNIFALDNIDSALNPGLVRQLMKHVTEILSTHKEKQIFITTHNPSTLDSIDLFDESHRLFVVSRSDTGQTQIKRIEPPMNMSKEEWEKKNYGLKLSEIWLSGAIGGLPKGFN